MTIIDFIKHIKFHTPNEELNEHEKQMVKQNGLIHFCNSENVDDILRDGIKGNLSSPIKKKEKGYTWFYIYDEMFFSEKLRLVHEKGKRKLRCLYYCKRTVGGANEKIKNTQKI